MFRLEFELCSYADLRDQRLLARLGRAFDSAPDLKPDRMDTREPVRSMIASAEAYLADAAALLADDDVLIERRPFPRISAELTAPAYGAREDPEQPHRLHGEMAEGDSGWLFDEEHLDVFARWLARLADAFDAFYGYAADHQLAHQQAGEFGRLRRDKRWAPPPPGPESDRHSIRDVCWLNYFGPAYVEKWGDRLVRQGVRSLGTGKGGVVVWSTPTPFVYREDVASFMEYGWKRPFYDALGRDAFVNAILPAWVSKVPTRDEHLRALTGTRDRR
jgi:hypothetical protein